jgi:legumain
MRRKSHRWPVPVQAMVGAWERECGRLDQYGMQHSRAFANLCNAGVSAAQLSASAAAACAPEAAAAAVQAS